MPTSELSVTAAIGTDKANVLRGQPTEIVGKKDLTELRRALRAKGFQLDLPSEELPDPPQIERESVDA